MSQGLEILKHGRRLMAKATRITAIEGPTDEAHQSIRDAISTLRSAMNWLEDSPEFEDAHELLDCAGRFARTTFPSGCRLTFRDGTYLSRMCSCFSPQSSRDEPWHGYPPGRVLYLRRRPRGP
jgi:hypothetical protein